jgi:hypothetical protein
MNILAGASWNHENKLKSLYKQNEYSYSTLKEIHNHFVPNKIIDKEINNFRRISLNSKLYSLLTGLALYDSNIKLNSESKENTGVISCTHNASTPDNEKYFKDYISAGRTMARGNLFVYTLPTSPLGEVAISYQLKGPLFYSNYSGDRLEMFIEQAEFMLNTNQAENLICIFTDKLSEICLFFANNNKKIENNNKLPISSIKKEFIKGSSSIEFVEQLQRMSK